MNIQPNILLWTILCFCAFMLILWRLLLKPMLTFLDARKARIAHARSLDKSAEEAEKKALAEAKKQLEERQRAQARNQAILQLREDTRLKREEREAGYRREMQARMAEVETEASDLVPQLAVSLKEHVNAFTDKLIAFGER